MTRTAVFGTGTWGTAFAMVLCDAGTDTILCGRRPDLISAIRERRENPEYLPGVALPDELEVTTDPATALSGADFVVLAIPAQHLRHQLASWVNPIPGDAVLVSLAKGVELGTNKRMSEVVCEAADVPAERVSVVTGPNLAREIAARRPAAAVVACVDEGVATRFQRACHTGYFRPYTNTDVVGCELGGAVKNVIALSVGMAEGMELGDNAKASLITRGLAETARLGTALGADARTFSGLAGLGDLVATCTSALSRNRTFGVNLGRGLSVPEASGRTKQTVEGVKSCEAIAELAAKHNVDMPITATVAAVVAGTCTPGEALRSLMARSAKSERHGLL